MDARLIPMRATGNILPAGAHCSNGWDVVTPWHYHDMHQLLYAFDGAVEVEGRHGCYKVPRQFAVWIPAGAVHRTTIQKIASGSVFLSPRLMPCAMDAPRVIAAPILLREMVMHAMRWPLDRAEDAVSDAYFTCFARLCEGWIAEDVKLLLPSSADARIAAAMAYTNTNIAAVTLSDICRETHMSERTLRRQFQKVAGMSWEDYRQRLRISLALDALDGTPKRIGEIAAGLGYQNQAAFARAFRSATGVAPREYRQRQ
jgi:AraC-like DNA-binding protein